MLVGKSRNWRVLAVYYILKDQFQETMCKHIQQWSRDLKDYNIVGLLYYKRTKGELQLKMFMMTI